MWREKEMKESCEEKCKLCVMSHKYVKLNENVKEKKEIICINGSLNMQRLKKKKTLEKAKIMKNERHWRKSAIIEMAQYSA
jgi:hypothetical protein